MSFKCFLLLALALWSCGDSPTGSDRTSPMVAIVFPSDRENYDRDGDGLVDIEVQFTDSGSGVDETTLELAASRPAGPQGQGGTDLLQVFEVVARDSASAVLGETTEALLPDGEVILTVRVSDRAGRTGEATRTIELPAGAFHRRLDLGLPPAGAPVNVEILPDGSRGYVLGDLGRLSLGFVPFDPHTLEFFPPIESPAVSNPFDAEYDPVAQRVFAVSINVPFMVVLDPSTGTLEASIPIFSRGVGVERGPQSGLLYVALSTTPAAIAVVDPVERRQVRVIQTAFTDPSNPGQEAFLKTPRLPAIEDRIYVPLSVGPGGILVLDQASGELLEWIDINPSPGQIDNPVESTLDRLRQKLYVADLSGAGAGLVEIDITRNEVARRITTERPGAKFPVLSPSGNRLFVTLGGVGLEADAENWLVDTTTFTILQRFQSINPCCDNDAAFRPDGQLVFVASGGGLAVYLNRGE
ncbi:MAG: YncE family protein [Gemmatimonadota bacterium]